MIVRVILAMLLVACTREPEDTGARLLRECQAIMRESRPLETRPEYRDELVRHCVERRGLAGK